MEIFRLAANARRRNIAPGLIVATPNYPQHCSQEAKDDGDDVNVRPHFHAYIASLLSSSQDHPSCSQQLSQV